MSDNVEQQGETSGEELDVRKILTRTKAGRRFMGFMRTLNAGDDEALKALVDDAVLESSLEKHSADQWFAQLQYIYAISQGLKVLQVLAEQEYRVVVLMEAHKNGQKHVIDMAVGEDYPHKVAQFVQRMVK